MVYSSRYNYSLTSYYYDTCLINYIIKIGKFLIIKPEYRENRMKDPENHQLSINENQFKS